MTVLYEIKTVYHDIRVVEDYPIRKLIFGSGFCCEQSAINLETPTSHVYDYSFMAMHSLLITPEPSKILIIGLGGAVIPREMEKYIPNSTIDIIEIDTEIVKIAKKYFFFKENDRVKIHIGDAFSVISKMSEKYDIVVLDAFSTSYIPFHLMSLEFLKKVFDVTLDNGVVAINASNVHPSFNSQVNTIRSVFGEVIYRLNGYNNLNATMLFVLKKDKDIIQLHQRPLCHFLVVQPSRLVITDKIKDAKILSIKNI